MSSKRFTIGAGSDCDLRLGGECVPELHSVVSSNDGGHWLEAQSTSPPLVVNGETRQRARLRSGDRVEIGEFEFVVLMRPADNWLEPVASIPLDASSASAEQHDDAIPDLETLSASDVADLIEAEHARVIQYERGRRVGAEALLRAVRERARQSTGRPDDLSAPLLFPIALAQSSQSHPADAPAGQDLDSNAAPDAAKVLDSRLADEILQLCQRLSHSAAQVQARWPEMTAHDPEFAAALARVLAAQQQLAGRIGAIRAAATFGDPQSQRPNAGSGRAIA